MLIPSQLPQFVTPARAGALQALALQSGQVLDAKIIGAAPNGGTQVEIRGQLLNLILPTMVKTGETIKLEVQGTGQQMRLALQPATVPTTSTPASPAPAALTPQVSMPLPNPTSPPPTVPPGAAAPLPAQAASNQPAQVPQPAVPTTTQPQPTPAAGGSATVIPAQPQATGGGTATVTAPPLPQAAVQAGSPPAAAAPAAAPVGVPATPVPLTPYPVASATTTSPVAAAVAAAAGAPANPAPQAAASAARPVVPAVAVGTATAHSSPGNPSPQPPPPLAATPQAALTQMVHASVPRQGTVTALTTALTSVAGKVVLPEPVARAAQQVLAGRVAIDAPRFDGTALQTAIRGSGVFQEASLTHGQALLPQSDMKSALLTLRQTLTSWLGQQAPVNAVSQIPPPLRGSTPRARAGEAPPIDPGAAPEEVGKQLLERTESALARVRLHQHASLPDPVSRSADWSMDLPVMVGTQQTLMHIHIHGDQQGDAEAPGERGWQMRFALSLPEMGEVGAQVTLRAGATGVMLWATEPTASAALEAEIASLRETLGGAGLRPGAVIVRHGEPPAPAAAAPSGHFVDAHS